MTDSLFHESNHTCDPLILEARMVYFGPRGQQKVSSTSLLLCVVGPKDYKVMEALNNTARGMFLLCHVKVKLLLAFQCNRHMELLQSKISKADSAL